MSSHLGGIDNSWAMPKTEECIVEGSEMAKPIHHKEVGSLRGE